MANAVVRNNLVYEITVNGKERLVGTLKEVMDGQKKVKGTTDQATASAKKQTAAITKTKKAAAGLTATIKSMAMTYISLYAAVGAFKAVMRAGMEQENAVNSLNASLKNSAVYTNEFSQALQDNASALQKQTIYGDEAILAATALMQNVGHLGQDVLPGAQKAAIGLAAAFKMDLQTAFMLVGRAAAGDTALLTRYGIKLDTTASKQDQFNQLLEIGADNFALAEAATKTLEGKMIQLKNAWGDLLETIEKRTEPAMKAAVDGFQDGLDAIAKNISDTQDDVEDKSLEMMENIRGWAAGIPIVLTSLFTFSSNLVMGHINILIGAGRTLAAIFEAVFEYADSTGRWLGSLQDMTVMDIGDALVTGNWERFSPSGFGFAETTKDLKKDLNTASDNINTAVEHYLKSFSVPEQFHTSVVDLIDKILADRVLDRETGTPAIGEEAGTAFIQGVAGGIAKNKSRVWDAIDAMLEKTIDDVSSYYESVKFEDERYYDWKVAQIQYEVEQMSIAADMKARLIDFMIGKIDEERVAYLKRNTAAAEKAPSAYSQFLEDNEDMRDAIIDLTNIVTHNFRKMITEGQSLSDVMKNIFLNIAEYAIQQIQRIIAQWIAMQLMMLAFKIGTGNVAGAMVDTNLFSPTDPGMLPVASTGGGRMPLPTPTPNPSGASMMSIVNELRTLRRQMASQRVKMDFRKGDLAYAVANDNKYMVNI